MFLAFAAALRSADLSRQVGAVIAKDKEILATGANDCPKAGGGLYWPICEHGKITDVKNGRDYMRGEDKNVQIKSEIIDDIAKKVLNADEIKDDRHKQGIKETIAQSRIKDIMEYGRSVHAEMEALLCCARNSISARDATLYSTTFPCHNCAKHIVGAGIERVVYIEPYAKSKAAELHNDSISVGINVKDEGRVCFEPFVGVGPTRFLELFCIKSRAGSSLKRKRKDGSVTPFDREKARLRSQMLPSSYIDREYEASERIFPHMQ
jgi:deoxycytidylate deaminase